MLRLSEIADDDCASGNFCIMTFSNFQNNMVRQSLFLLIAILTSANLSAQDGREKFKFAKFSYDNGKYEDALGYLNQAIELDAAYISAYFLRAETHYALGNYYNAIQDINRIFRIDNTPNASTSDYLLVRGKSFLAIDDFSQAGTDFRRSVAFAKTNAEAHYHLALLSFKTRNNAQALQEIDTALSINHNNPDYYMLRAKVRIAHEKPEFGSEVYQQILADINAAVVLDERNADYRRIRGDFFKSMGQKERAMEDFDAMISLSPKEEVAYTSRGLIKMNQFEYQSAVLDFTRSILINPELEANYRYRGICYNNLNNLREAYKDFSVSIKMLKEGLNTASDPELAKKTLAETYVLRGHCSNLLGNDQQACMDFLAANNLGLRKGWNYYRKYCGIY
jgi:tetratricopeptide (TPR) repeat protein